MLFCPVSDGSGIVPNQKPIESHHHTIKATAVNQLRVSTGHVLVLTLPKVMVECAMDNGSETIQHFAAGPVPAELLQAAIELCSDGPTHKRKSRRPIQSIQTYFFNERYYVIRDDNVHGLKVTAGRTKTYRRSVDGPLKEDEIVENVQLRYLSLHMAKVLDRAPYEHNWSSPSLVSRGDQFDPPKIQVRPQGGFSDRLALCSCAKMSSHRRQFRFDYHVMRTTSAKGPWKTTQEEKLPAKRWKAYVAVLR
ncbi:hypothetical protein GQ600_24299 [Phytophthora cactorum]|nr:hypothetical protein GQ600_24299 [Phytophthora cactorum]